MVVRFAPLLGKANARAAALKRSMLKHVPDASEQASRPKVVSFNSIQKARAERDAQARAHQESLKLDHILAPRPVQTITEKTAPYASFDRQINTQLISSLASANGGRNALRILERLEDPDAEALWAKGHMCLQAYWQAYRQLTPEAQRKVLLEDGAAQIVIKWVQRPAIWNLLWEPIDRDEDYEETRVQSVHVIAFILVQSSCLSTLEQWILHIPPKYQQQLTARDLSYGDLRQGLWFPCFLFFKTVVAMIDWWNPRGKVTGAIKACQFYMKVQLVARHVSCSQAAARIRREVRDLIGERIDPRSAERLQAAVDQILEVWDAETTQDHMPTSKLSSAVLKLSHPVNPNPDALITWLKEMLMSKDPAELHGYLVGPVRGQRTNYHHCQ
ncbi:hypothetical protein GGR57DRAFT_173052 [Xylariaceae sp. FL1272]|nr:hypothetical protein GGR57DRAFT_173052 [Xylariaceae sp. FL1272]